MIDNKNDCHIVNTVVILLKYFDFFKHFYGVTKPYF